MDGTRFDRITRAFATERSRRGLVGGVLGFGLGLGGLRMTAAACPPGQVSRRGTCLCKTTGRPPGRDEGCPCANGLTDTGDGLGCQECRTDGDCGPATICGGGGVPNVCDCAGARNGEFCTTNEACCSGICQALSCVATLAGTCPPGADFCQDEASENVCGNGFCSCFPSLSGATICAGGRACFACTSDADCAAEFVNGFVCASGGDCCGGGTACVLPCPPIVSCFIAGTRVALADGTSRPIEDLTIGEEVLGRDGRTNRVLEIERPLLGGRLLYALNDGPFFVTAEHPFLTEAGWKAIDPAATAAENPALVVERLTVGDRLLVLAGVAVPAGFGGWDAAEPVEAHLEAVTLERIGRVVADPATPLYNLRLDGDHAYFANDWLVHNK